MCEVGRYEGVASLPSSPETCLECRHHTFIWRLLELQEHQHGFGVCGPPVFRAVLVFTGCFSLIKGHLDMIKYLKLAVFPVDMSSGSAVTRWTGQS